MSPSLSTICAGFFCIFLDTGSALHHQAQAKSSQSCMCSCRYPRHLYRLRGISRPRLVQNSVSLQSKSLQSLYPSWSLSFPSEQASSKSSGSGSVPGRHEQGIFTVKSSQSMYVSSSLLMPSERLLPCFRGHSHHLCKRSGLCNRSQRSPRGRRHRCPHHRCRRHRHTRERQFHHGFCPGAGEVIAIRVVVLVVVLAIRAGFKGVLLGKALTILCICTVEVFTVQIGVFVIVEPIGAKLFRILRLPGATALTVPLQSKSSQST